MRPSLIVALLLVLPCSAAAATRGLSPPRALTPAGGHVWEPVAVVAPTAHTGVVWQQRRGDAYELAAALGRTPDSLGAARRVPGSSTASEVALATGHQGLVVLCFAQERYRRVRTGIRCATSQ